MKHILILCLGFISINTDANGIHSPLEDRISYQAGSSDTLPAISTTLNIPAVTGSLTIDGKLNDAFWQSAPTQTLTNPASDPFGQGGEARIAVRGDYLCLSARIPESDRLVTRSTGINPTWWQEDMIVWRLRYTSPISHENVSATLVANPLGAFSLFAGNYYSYPEDYYNYHGISAMSTRDDIYNPNTINKPLKWASDVLAAAAIGQSEWTVELALPLKQFGTIGFMSIERVRARRPNVPLLSWYWPAPNESTDFKLAGSNTEPSPLFPPTALPRNPVTDGPETPGSSLASEVTALPKQAWTKEEQESLETRAMLKKSIQSRMAGFAQEEKLAWQKVHTVKDWEHFRDKGLDAMRNQIGPLPERTPLHETVTRRSNVGDGFVIENIVYESRPHLIVTANLYLPEHPSGKIPAIVVIHSQHAAKEHSELQNMGMTWARSGTAVLVMDQICAGERSAKSTMAS